MCRISHISGNCLSLERETNMPMPRSLSSLLKHHAMQSTLDYRVIWMLFIQICNIDIQKNISIQVFCQHERKTAKLQSQLQRQQAQAYCPSDYQSTYLARLSPGNLVWNWSVFYSTTSLTHTPRHTWIHDKHIVQCTC